MEDRGVSQSQLARIAGVSRATVTRVLSGHTKVHSTTEAKISAALGLELGALDRNRVELRYLNTLLEQNSSVGFGGLGVALAGRPLPVSYPSIAGRQCPDCEVEGIFNEPTPLSLRQRLADLCRPGCSPNP